MFVPKYCLALSVVFCVAISAADEPRPKDKAVDDAKRIQGTWVVVDLQQLGHKPTKEEKEFFKKGGYKITITAEKTIHLPDKSEGEYRLDTTKAPTVLEFVEGGKVVAKAIYELKGDDLKICMGRKSERGGAPEAPTDFDIKKAAPGTFPTLLVLKREAVKPVEKR